MQPSDRSSVARSIGEGLVAAVLSWLALLAVGAVLVAAARLQVPELGAGASAADIFTAVVVSALGTLGATVHLGSVELSFVPLGALGIVVYVFVRNLRTARDRVGEHYRAGRRAVVAASTFAFALLCGSGARLFQIEAGETVGADAGRSVVLGAAWMLVAWVFVDRDRADQTRSAGRYVAKWVSAPAMGARFGLISIAAACLIAAARLPGSAGRAIGAAVHFLAVAPNAAVAVAALSVGSSVELGASFSSATENLARSTSYSLFDWGGGPTPAVAWVLLAVPLIAGTWSGWAASRRAAGNGRALIGLWTAAGVCGAVLSVLANVSAARVAAGTLTRAGFASIAAHPLATLLFAPLVLGASASLGLGVARLYSRGRGPSFTAKESAS